MTEQSLLGPGVTLQKVATREIVYEGCTVLQADAVGLAFEVTRTVSEGGTIETAVSQILVPWGQILHVVVKEQTL
jgi:hypothetical protein